MTTEQKAVHILTEALIAAYAQDVPPAETVEHWIDLLSQAGLTITPKDKWQWVKRDDVPAKWKDGSGDFAVTCGWGDTKKVYLNCAFRARTWEASGIALDYMAIGHVCKPDIPEPPEGT